MRTRSTHSSCALFVLLLISSSYIDPANSTRSRWKRDRTAVRFPTEGSDASLKSSWRIKDPDSNSFSNALNRKSKMQDASEATGTRGWRKAEPDVQDIISGIVHLLGGKVNLHAANGAEVNAAGQSKPVPQSTRINNRGPPRVTEIPFEAIPLELGNSAADIRRPPATQQQLPFGIPIRRPLWPPTSGQTIQDLPFATGIPRPIQWVPPISNRPLPLPPNGKPMTLTVLNATESAINATYPDVSPTLAVHASSTHPELDYSYVESVEESTADYDYSSHIHAEQTSAYHTEEVSSFSFTFEEASAPVILSSSSIIATSASALVPSVSAFVPFSSTIVPSTSFTVTLTSSALPSEPVLESSMKDVTSTPQYQPESSSVAIESFSSYLTPQSSSDVMAPSATVTLGESTVLQNPELDAGYPLPTTYTSDQPFTPPLPDSRPGQVFSDSVNPSDSHHDADVITSDNIQPQGTYGETFELVVSANQNFGGYPPANNAPATGRPYVIPVNIDEIRSQGASGLLTGDSSTGDQFVSIDGRKTYFNLFPTDTNAGVGTPTRPPALQPTVAPNNRFPQVNVGGNGQIYPTSNGGYVRPAVPVRPAPAPAAAPASAPVRAPSPASQRPTPALIRRPTTTTPFGVIDACIVGDPNACADPNESCQKEEDGAVCNCKPGHGRRKTSDTCKQLAGYLVSIRLDRWADQRLSWSPAYSHPESPDYQQLQAEASQAIDSLMDMTPLSSVYVSSAINKFYSLNNKLVVNASVFIQQIPDTLLDSFRTDLQKQVASTIQKRDNKIGSSRLYVDGPFNPIPAVQDLNECGSPDLNDCSVDGICFNSAGTYSCRCRPGYSDPFESDPDQSGRKCNSCTPGYCNNRGECRIDNGRKICQCRGNYQGSQCELDGQVLGVAIGASLAAVVIIVLTLVFLCMWSRRWRQNQDKVDRSGFMEQLKTMPFPIMMQDRIRWAQYAEAMAATNLYAQPLAPPFYMAPSSASSHSPSSILHSSITPPSSVIHSTVSPPPVPPRNKPPARQVSSLPVDLTTSAMTNHMLGAIQHLARRISRKKRPAPHPDPVNVNPNLALISPAYPVGSLTGTMTSRASMAPTLPLVGSFHRTRSTNGSVHSYGKRNPPPPPPSNPPPPLPTIETSEESAAESDAPIARPFHVPRPRSRSSAFQTQNIYFEADHPSNEFSSHSQLSLSTYNQRNGGQRYYYR